MTKTEMAQVIVQVYMRRRTKPSPTHRLVQAKVNHWKKPEIERQYARACRILKASKTRAKRGPVCLCRDPKTHDDCCYCGTGMSDQVCGVCAEAGIDGRTIRGTGRRVCSIHRPKKAVQPAKKGATAGKTVGDINITEGVIKKAGVVVGSVMSALQHGYHPSIHLKVGKLDEWFEMDTPNLIDVIFDKVKEVVK